MDPLDFLENEELLRFFHCHKTEMSCMENPHTFLSQLRDHNLITEDRYKKMSRMKSKANMKKALYEFLDWLESEQSEHIKVFWSAVFKDTIMTHYPTLRLLRNSLMDGSFHFVMQLPEKLENDIKENGKRTKVSEDEEKEKKASLVKKKRKQRSVCDEEEQAGPSSQMTPGQGRKSKKICFSSPAKKGENPDIWTWPIYKVQLPVTCGQQEGLLNRDRLAKGMKCIAVKGQWFSPPEFERFAGKQSYKNWKISIRCMDTPLGKLIQDGHLASVRYKGGRKNATKSLFPSDQLTTVSDEEDDEDENKQSDSEDQASSSGKQSTDFTDEEGEREEQAEQQPEDSCDSEKNVFKVTCGALSGTLHVRRFASGTLGKSIRTETSWMTPVEFVKRASCRPDASWRKDIKWEGNPLSVLTEAKILKIHSLLCQCQMCRPDRKAEDDQNNDDECCICKGYEELVVCDQCPRSFHQECHLPHVEDAICGDGSKWLCTFCVFTSNQECYYQDELNRDAIMSCQISPNMLQCQYLLLRLRCADEDQTFATNPSTYLQDYGTVIEAPMWLGKIADKLQQQLYETVGEFVSDVELIFSNCASYNRENAEYLTTGDRLKKSFDEDFKNVFNICE